MSLFSDAEVQEFIIEARELLDQAETDLLKSDTANYVKLYDSIFRVFHSLKGGAGMLGFDDLQKHMHQLENILSGTKGRESLSKEECDFFLAGVDVSRKILDGNKIEFDYNVKPSNSTTETTPTTPPGKTHNVHPPSPRTGRPKGLVYVVDDEAPILEVVSDALSDIYVECKTFLDPKELLEACSHQAPDLVVSDIKMPEMSGIEVLQRLHLKNKDIPVILLSGFISKEILIEAIESGIYAAIEKPFQYNTFVNHCLSAIKHSQIQKMFRKSLHLLVYQFGDLEEYLIKSGKSDFATALRKDINEIMATARELGAG